MASIPKVMSSDVTNQDQHQHQDQDRHKDHSPDEGVKGRVRGGLLKKKIIIIITPIIKVIHAPHPTRAQGAYKSRRPLFQSLSVLGQSLHCECWSKRQLSVELFEIVVGAQRRGFLFCFVVGILYNMVRRAILYIVVRGLASR